MSMSLTTCARYSMLGLVVAAPWMQGSASAWASRWISCALLIVGIICLLAAGRRGMRQLLGGEGGVAGRRTLLALSAGILVYGWLATLFPRSVYDSASKLLFHMDGSPWHCWGSIHRPDSIEAMVRITALFFSFCSLLQMVLESRWRRRVVVVLSCTAVSVAVYGLLQRLAGDFVGVWGGRTLSVTVFGPYWYHANAATFLNLCWPLLWYLMHEVGIQGVSVERGRMLRWMPVAGLLAIALALFINISKAGQAIFLLQLALLTMVHRFLVERVNPLVSSRRSSIKMPAIVIAVLLLGIVGASTTGSRWHYLLKNPEHDQRMLVVGLCVDALRDSGWVGWGAGTFQVGFAAFAADLPDRPHGIWVFAHNDYLQSLLEWGVFGLLLVVGVLLCVMVQVLRRLGQAVRHGDASNLALLGACMTSGLGFLAHAAVDYPSQIVSLQLCFLAITAIALSGRSFSRA